MADKYGPVKDVYVPKDHYTGKPHAPLNVHPTSCCSELALVKYCLLPCASRLHISITYLRTLLACSCHWHISRFVCCLPVESPCNHQALHLACTSTGMRAGRSLALPTGAHTRCVGAGEGRGLAFIEFVNNRDAEDAKYGMDRQIMDGKEVRSCLTLRLLAHVHHVAEQKAHICRVAGRSASCREASGHS